MEEFGRPKTKLRIRKLEEGEFKVKSAVEDLPELSFYPNPSNGRFRLRFKVEEELDLSIQITDHEKEIIYARKMEDFYGTYSEMIDLTDQRPGKYLLEIDFGGKKKYRKVEIDG
jgi:hypothetical protein